MGESEDLACCSQTALHPWSETTQHILRGDYHWTWWDCSPELPSWYWFCWTFSGKDWISGIQQYREETHVRRQMSVSIDASPFLGGFCLQLLLCGSLLTNRVNVTRIISYEGDSKSVVIMELRCDSWFVGTNRHRNIAKDSHCVKLKSFNYLGTGTTWEKARGFSELNLSVKSEDNLDKTYLSSCLWEFSELVKF